MTDSVAPSHWSFSCSDVGFPCEWRLRVGSVEELETRFREHSKCAHPTTELSGDLLGRVRSAARAT
jgi:predicted small metal-binding protein